MGMGVTRKFPCHPSNHEGGESGLFPEWAADRADLQSPRAWKGFWFSQGPHMKTNDSLWHGKFTLFMRQPILSFLLTVWGSICNFRMKVLMKTSKLLWYRLGKELLYLRSEESAQGEAGILGEPRGGCIPQQREELGRSALLWHRGEGRGAGSVLLLSCGSGFSRRFHFPHATLVMVSFGLLLWIAGNGSHLRSHLGLNNLQPHSVLLHYERPL